MTFFLGFSISYEIMNEFIGGQRIGLLNFFVKIPVFRENQKSFSFSQFMLQLIQLFQKLFVFFEFNLTG